MSALDPFDAWAEARELERYEEEPEPDTEPDEADDAA